MSMRPVRDVSILALGLVLRYVCSQMSHLVPWYWSYFLVHAMQLNMAECVFLFNRGGTELPSHCPAATRVLSLPVLLVQEQGFRAPLWLFPLIATLGQVATTALLYMFSYRLHCSKRGDAIKKRDDGSHESCQGDMCCCDCGDNSGLWSCLPALFYWLSPWSVVSTTLSPLPSLSHALMLMTIYLATGRSDSDSNSSPPIGAVAVAGAAAWVMCLLASSGLLLSLQTSSLPLLLLLFFTHSAPSAPASSISSALSARWLQMVVVGMVAVAGVAAWQLSGKGVEAGALALALEQAPAREYHPGFGVLW